MLVGIDASRAVSDSPTGTENYSRELIRALLDADRKNSYRLYTRQAIGRDFFSSHVIARSALSTGGASLCDEATHLQCILLAPHASPKGSVKTEGLAESAGVSKEHGDCFAPLAMTVPNFEIRAMPFPRLWTHARLSLEMLFHPPGVLFVPAHVVPLIHPRRTIATIHDLGHLHFPNSYPVLQRLYHRWSAARNVRAASHIFADSQATKQDITEFFRVAPEKITVIYPSYNAQLFQPVRDQSEIEKAKARYGIEGNYALTIGTIHPRKNYLRLIQAFRRLEIRDWRLKVPLGLVIVGKRGWRFDSIFREVEDSNLQSLISFVDYVPDSDLPALLSGARLFVLPSLHEGFGLPILEAQACGAPVVCSNRSSLPEAAGDAAVFFDPNDVEAIADAMQRVLQDESLRHDLIARGFENVKRFSWQASAQAVIKVFEIL